jgi:hypothetical protein
LAQAIKIISLYIVQFFIFTGGDEGYCISNDSIFGYGFWDENNIFGYGILRW